MLPHKENIIKFHKHFIEANNSNQIHLDLVMQEKNCFHVIINSIYIHIIFIKMTIIFLLLYFLSMNFFIVPLCTILFLKCFCFIVSETLILKKELKDFG